MKVRDGRLDLVGLPWRDEYVRVFVERGCTGVMVGPGHHKAPAMPDADFLTRIPGLRTVAFFRGVRDISVVSRLPDLRELTVAIDYKGPLSLSGMSELESLSMPYLPAVRDLAGLTRLRDLMIYFWPRGRDLAVLGPKPELVELRLEFERRARFSSAPLADAPRLRKLWLYDGSCTDVSGLSALTELRELHLYGTSVPSLSFVAGMPHLDWLYAEKIGKVDGLGAVRDHPAVRIAVVNGVDLSS